MQIGDIYINAELADVLEELASELALNDIPLMQKRKNLQTHIQVQCPYHNNGQEKKPSAGIRKSDGVFHCFACNEVHSLPEVISFCFGKYDDLVGRFGWKWLLKNFSHVDIKSRDDVDLDICRGKDTKSIEYVSEEELDRYRYYHPYWKERKIVDDDIIELFDLGYDRATDCITFPVRDINGDCLFVARRSVRGKKFYYPQGVEKPLYGLYELYEQHHFPSEIIVCESMIDALTAWQYGAHAVALNGLGTDLQFKQLRDLPCRELILATDNDEAGRKARCTIRKAIKNKLITEYIFPKGIKDLNMLDFIGFQQLEKNF